MRYTFRKLIQSPAIDDFLQISCFSNPVQTLTHDDLRYCHLRASEALTCILLPNGHQIMKTTPSVKFCIPFGPQKKWFCPQTGKKTKKINNF